MKKIIATVLAMVMALALCTTAFAAEQGYDVYTKAGTKKNSTDGTYYTLVYHAASKTNKTIAYYTMKDQSGADVANEMYVAVEAADADYVLKYKGTETIAMYLADATLITYTGEASVYTDIGSKCGQYKLNTTNNETKTTKFFTAVDDDDVTYLFKEVSTGHTDLLLVNGVVYRCAKIGKLSEKVVGHTWVVDAEKAAAKCSNCGATGKVYKTFVEVPSGAEAEQVAGVWVVADATPATDTKTDSNTSSPKTFDAGIAMYVGMALTSVAGSAVVIGKKKEF